MLPQPLPVRRLFHDQRRLRSGAEGSIVPDARNITKILEPLFEFRRGQNQYRPILLKVSPDLSDETIDLMTDIMLDTPLDGMVAVNATVSREESTGSKRRASAPAS